MKTTYINGVGCISAQNTFEVPFLELVMRGQNTNVLYAQEPNYKKFIPPAAIRRMAKGVKMGIASSNRAMEEAGAKTPDAIITGTGMGCLQDSEKFLKTLLANNENYLTPTSFIQSTHNTVGAQIALGLGCKGYNFTYVNGASSLESALVDTKMQIATNEATSVLVGGIDETAGHTLSLYKLIGRIKADTETNYQVLSPTSTGAVFSEGASFFVMENEKKESTYAILEDITIQNRLEKQEVASFIQNFLEKNNTATEAVDAVILGNNGDIAFDTYYKGAEALFKNTPQLYYKQLSGEYNTASGFGLWLAANVIKHQRAPECTQKNKLEKKQYKTLLLYNQYRGKDHSLILLRHADV